MHHNRSIEIWTYRYHKYLDIFLSIYHWFLTYCHISLSRLSNSQRPHIAILLAEHFGDIVACEPLSRDFKKQYPNAKIYWIVKKSYRELLDFNPNVDVIIEEYSVLYSVFLTRKHPFDNFYNCHLSGLRRYKYLRKTLQNPLAISLNILTDNYFNHGNILEVFAKVGGLPIINEPPKIYIPNSVKKSIENLKLPSKKIVIHCHSNYSPKDWQVYYWERLVIDLLNSFDFAIIEIGLKSTLKIHHSGYYDYCGKLSLLETAELIADADYFIGIDSGPAHFANAVNTFGFLLFGKLGDFENYMPYSGKYQAKTNVKFITKKGEPCSELEYDEVWNVIFDNISQNKLVNLISDFSDGIKLEY